MHTYRKVTTQKSFSSTQKRVILVMHLYIQCRPKVYTLKSNLKISIQCPWQKYVTISKLATVEKNT